MRIIQFELDTPTPLRALMLNLSLPTPPSRHKRAVFFSGIVLRTLFSPCRPCECVSHRTCDVLLTHSRSQLHFLSPSTLSFVLKTKFSRLLLDLRLTQSWRPVVLDLSKTVFLVALFVFVVREQRLVLVPVTSHEGSSGPEVGMRQIRSHAYTLISVGVSAK